MSLANVIIILKYSVKLRRYFNIIITLARIICKLPDDGRRPKHVGTISF